MSVEIFGLNFESSTLSEAAEAVVLLSVNHERSLIVTPNVDHIVNIQTDAEMKSIFEEAKYRYADGMPIVWASHILPGVNSLPERVTGADLLPAVCAAASEKKQSVFFLGGQPGVAEKAVVNLKSLYPLLEVAGYYCPPFGFEFDVDETSKIINIINNANTDILFIGVGTPKQEKWAYANIDRLDVGPVLGVGAAFDFAAGDIQRAPKLIQSLGCEWLWRLLHEPKRLFKRYLIDLLMFIYIFIKELFYQLKK